MAFPLTLPIASPVGGDGGWVSDGAVVVVGGLLLVVVAVVVVAVVVVGVVVVGVGVVPVLGAHGVVLARTALRAD
jgi:hypothetical protein